MARFVPTPNDPVLELRKRQLLGSLEALLEGGYGLALSPLQRAVARALEGRPLGELGALPGVREAFGGALPPEGIPPFEVLLLSAIRVGKSQLAAASAVLVSQRCDVSRLSPGEVPRVSIVSLSLDLAQPVRQHLVALVQGVPALSTLLLDEPKADRVLLRHPSGRPIEIRTVAGARSGASLVARWSAGVVFDEAPRMLSAADAVVNLEDLRAAVLGRLLPGAQILQIGSPWAPFGPVYEAAEEGWGHPSRDLLVIRAPGWEMHPGYWTPERCETLRASDPDVWATDCAAQWGTPESALFPLELLAGATREAPLDLAAAPGLAYSAAIDPATRGNAWTLVVTTAEGGRRRVVLAREWKGSRETPLSPREVFAAIAAILAPYKVRTLHTDQWSVDALRDPARDSGFALVEVRLTERETTAKYLALRVALQERRVELAPEPVLRQDLQRVKRRVTQTGVSIVLPHTSDGRHCDYAPALILALAQYLQEEAPPTPEPDALVGMRRRAAAEAARRRRGGGGLA